MTPHTTNASPVPPATWVQIDLGDGEQHIEQARHVAWGPGVGPDGLGRVLAYSIVAAPADADA